MRSYSKYALPTVFFLLFIYSYGQQVSQFPCRITGEISGMENGQVKLEAIVFGSPVAFDAPVKSGKFEFQINQPAPTAYNLKVASKPEDVITIFCDSGPNQFKAKFGQLRDGSFTGSPSQADWTGYNKLVNRIDDAMRAVQYTFDDLAAKQQLSGKEDSLRNRYQLLSIERDQTIGNWVIEHRGSNAAPFIIAINYLSNPQPEVIRALYDPLTLEVKGTYYGKIINEVLQKYEALEIGKIAPDFSQTDLEGKVISLESFRGKYVLLDFWASWCGPCRAENPNLVRTYDRFSSKMEILGISLDQKQDSWIKAIQADGLTWKHVSDLKGWSNAVAKKYNVQSIPANFLLDPSGKIIAKGLRGAALEQTLETLLK